MKSKTGGEPGSVLLLVSNLGLGGAERQLVYLALGLRRRGWKVTVASLSPLIHPPFKASFDEAGVSLDVLQGSMKANMMALLRALRATWRLARIKKPDAIVGFMPHGVVFARAIGTLLGVPRIVASLRSIRSTRRWHDRILAATRALDHVLVANSQAAAKAQVRARVTTAAKSIVIRNGLEIEPPSRCNDRGDSPGEGKFVWLHVAVFRTEKGHSTLLHAMRLLSLDGRVRLLLAGEGPRLEATRQLAADLDLLDSIEFLGQRTDIPDLIHSADAFVLPSLWEGLPNALIEALAGGLPAVATNVGGSPEVLQHGVSGLLVRPEDPAELASAMRQMMDMSAADRRRMGAAGREHVLANYSMEGMISSWEQLLRSCGEAEMNNERLRPSGLKQAV